MIEELQRGREAYRRRRWAETFRALSRADEAMPLAVEDLELLATSAYLIGREDDYLTSLERAHHAYLESAGGAEQAARCAFWSGLDLLFRGETGRASGWLARAERLIEGRDCVEQGYLLLPASERDLAGGAGVRAYEKASEAASIGERFRDKDLVACARHLQGRALIQQERLPAGLALLDETMVSVVAGELSPIVTGLLYCSVIETCHKAYVPGRAREWTDALAAWCERQPEMVAFRATCLVHRAEVLRLTGALTDALEEARRACERQGAPGAAYYQMAEIHRVRGDLGEAEAAYRMASRMGRDPQPGLALLRLSQGRIDAACAAMRRVLGTVRDPLERATLLPAHVEVLLAAGDRQEAREAARELWGIASRMGGEVLEALAIQSSGAVDLAEGEAGAALEALRRAFDVWHRLEAPYEAARVRVQMALACRALGDEEAAELELTEARALFGRLEAAPELARLDTLARRQPPPAGHPLSPREIQVLRRVATGRTNREIAAELCLSERTIDRHVSNILTKLDVPSRTAATARAYEDGLL